MKEYGSEFERGAEGGFSRGDSPGLGLSGAEYYRSGRDAMKAAAALGGRKPSVVLLPALCCQSMIVPFRLNGCPVEFYRLREDLTGDTDDVLGKLRDGAMLLYMRYFGIRPFEDAFLAGLKNRFKDILLVEDRTQDIIVPRAAGGFAPDATVASLRKWAPLPEGGLLVTELSHQRGEPDSGFGDMRRAAAVMKDEYLQRGQPELKTELMDKFHSAEGLLDMGPEPRCMHESYVNLLERTDFPKILERRRENIRRLRERLEPLRAAGRLRFLTERPEDGPLYFPILLESRGEAQRRMWDSGIYCPVIWPRPEETEDVCPVSAYVTEHMLALICDQRYSAEDMDYIARTLAEALD